jgi:hypothetical protein
VSCESESETFAIASASVIAAYAFFVSALKSGNRVNIVAAGAALLIAMVKTHQAAGDLAKCKEEHGKHADAEILDEHARQLEADHDLLKARLDHLGAPA